MPDKRPFVDRRLGFVVLYESKPDASPEGISDIVKDAVDNTGGHAYVTNVINKGSTGYWDDPPQTKIILSESSLPPESVKGYSDEIRNSIRRETGAGISTIETVSLAMSPGDKVRNAMGV